MNNNYDKFRSALKRVFPLEEITALGGESGFIRRERVVGASSFLWALAMSRFGHERPGFEQARQRFIELSGSNIYPCPFQNRFKSESVGSFMEGAFHQATTGFGERRFKHPLAKEFTDIVAWDATSVQLNDGLSDVFPGSGRAAPASASAKIFLGMSVFGNIPLAARIRPGKLNDHKCGPVLDEFSRGTLFLFDKGFASAALARQIVEAQQSFLCPMPVSWTPRIVEICRAPRRVQQALANAPGGLPLRNVLPRPPANKESRRRRPNAKRQSARLSKVTSNWDLTVEFSIKNQPPLRVRLVILKGPNGQQRPYITNVTTLPPKALSETYRLRWQIERTFKELKQNLNLGSIPTKNEHAARAFIWASLIALLVSRVIAGVLAPLGHAVGLALPVRLNLVSRTLRTLHRLLIPALDLPTPRGATKQNNLPQLLMNSAAQPTPQRPDSFARLIPLLA